MYKRGRNEDLGNYQPFSLFSIPGKVMEQLILEAILKCMEDNITSSQHVGLKMKSCLGSLIASYDGTARWIDEGRMVDVVYLNFSISQNILMCKLRKRGLDNWTVKWIENCQNGHASKSCDQCHVVWLETCHW